MSTFTTDQERFWAGDFGDAYVDRRDDPVDFRASVVFFSKILARAPDAQSFIEFGANVGMNLEAIAFLRPSAKFAAVEINRRAAGHLKERSFPIDVYNQSILTFEPPRTFDFAFTRAVLIHIDPARLTDVYDRLYRGSQRYICLAEYYNPTPVEIPYRGHAERMFKRDFAGEMLDRYPDLRLIDYGFAYHRDEHSLDDLTWFLLSKSAPGSGVHRP